MRLPHAFRPLSVPAYRLVFAGSGLSNLGTWMHRVAVDWLIYEQTGSLTWVGVVSFAQFAPLAVLGPLGGVLADRVDRRRLLLAAQVFMMLCAGALTAAQLAGVAGPGVLLAISLGLGIGFAVAGPTWQATVPQLVPRPMLTSAIALNSSKRSLSRIAGPAAGGVLLAAVGAGGVFAVNTASYLAVIAALRRLRLAPLPARHHGRVLAELRDGVRYVAASPTMRWLMTAVLLVSFVATPLVTLLPAYAADVLAGDASTLGQLTGSLGTGALLGSILLAQVGDRIPPPALVGGSILALAVTTATVAVAPGVGLVAAAVLGTGLFRLGSIAAVNTRLQALADESYRGRVMGLFMLGFGAAYPLGALLAGAVADVAGAQATTLGMAAATALTGVLVWTRLAAHGRTPPEAEAEAEAPPPRRRAAPAPSG